MSILIHGMEMPKGCAFCKISRRNRKKMICPFIWKCEWDIHDPMSADHRLDNCPLVNVPPHGRLIDADALKLDLTRFYENEVSARRLIDEQPTIIPASGEKENE